MKQNEIYLLICTGEDVFLSSKFKAICNTAFKENPLSSGIKYVKEVNSFLKNCRETKNHISAVKEGTEKLSVVKLKVI